MDSSAFAMILDGMSLPAGPLRLHGPVHGALAAGGGIDDLGNLFFFYEIKEFVNYRIDRFMNGLVGRTMSLAGAVALSLMTLWVLFKGFRILSGRSHDSLMAMVMDSLRAALIVAAATTMAAGGSSIVKVMADDMTSVIYHTVTGHPTENPYSAIDKSLGYMQLAMLSIDALDVSGDETIDSAKSRAQFFTGVGIAGPALVGGTLLMLNRIAMALFIGFGPIFILCLLFDSTKSLFNRWLMLGIGTMFSLAVLSVMVSLSLDVVLAVAAAFWAGKFIGANTEGISSMALQQGGLGMIMTMLIVTVPPMAASFFQGTIGQFVASNAFLMPGGGGRMHQNHSQHTSSYSGAAPEAQRPPANPAQGRMEHNQPRPTANTYNPANGPILPKSESKPDEIKSTPVA